MDKQLVGTFTGISPLFAKEVVKKAGMVNEKALADAFSPYKTIINSYIFANNDYFKWERILLSFPLAHLAGDNKTFSSVSELLDRFFSEKQSVTV